jgi:hypothetical protein
VRFPGEWLSRDKGHSQGEAHFPSQTRSADEAPRGVVLAFYTAPLQRALYGAPAWSSATTPPPKSLPHPMARRIVLTNKRIDGAAPRSMYDEALISACD